MSLNFGNTLFPPRRALGINFDFLDLITRQGFVNFFLGVLFAGGIVLATFFYGVLQYIPVISDFIRPPSYLSYDWVAVRLIIIGGLGVFIPVIGKSLWYIYQQKKEH